jgi:serine/threonine-protein kinase RsbT
VATSDSAETMPLNGSDDVVRARHRVRELLVELGFDLVAQTRIVTATSELARNTHLHGGGGRLTITPVDDGRRRGLRLVFADDGPGITDMAAALTDGWSSGGGLGLGLGGTRRLVDEFTIESTPGAGTRVEIVQWLKRR